MQLHDIIPSHIILAMDQPVFVLNYGTLYMSRIRQGSFNYQFQIFGLTRPGIEPGTSQTQRKCSITRLLVLVGLESHMYKLPLQIVAVFVLKRACIPSFIKIAQVFEDEIKKYV